jgi:hypothetical protein
MSILILSLFHHHHHHHMSTKDLLARARAARAARSEGSQNDPPSTPAEPTRPRQRPVDFSDDFDQLSSSPMSSLPLTLGPSTLTNMPQLKVVGERALKRFKIDAETATEYRRWLGVRFTQCHLSSQLTVPPDCGSR